MVGERDLQLRCANSLTSAARQVTEVIRRAVPAHEFVGDDVDGGETLQLLDKDKNKVTELAFIG